MSWDMDAEIFNDSVNALHGLLAVGGQPSSERLVAASLQDIAPSPFYNMTVAGEPAEKPDCSGRARQCNDVARKRKIRKGSLLTA